MWDTNPHYDKKLKIVEYDNHKLQINALATE